MYIIGAGGDRAVVLADLRVHDRDSALGPAMVVDRNFEIASGAIASGANGAEEMGVEPSDKPQITPEQAKIVRAQLAPILQYLGRLQERLKAIGFTEDYKLRQYAYRAYDAAFSLSTQMHFISVGGGFGFDALEKVKPEERVGNDSMTNEGVR